MHAILKFACKNNFLDEKTYCFFSATLLYLSSPVARVGLFAPLRLSSYLQKPNTLIAFGRFDFT
jgi:hypothetical protein